MGIPYGWLLEQDDRRGVNGGRRGVYGGRRGVWLVVEVCMVVVEV